MAAVSPSVYRPPRWTLVWLALSSLICTWDALYILCRPHSMKGGSLFWIWSPYHLYSVTDYMYGLPALRDNNGFVAAQSVLNLFENALNITALVLFAKQDPAGLLVGFTSSAITASKTVLYYLNDQQAGWAHTGHNSRWNWWTLFFFPSSFWLLFPSLLVIVYGRQIARTLRAAATGKEKVK
ncbi:hypothetical protein JCM10207_008131 [Rhodosporidiobolus poonsookiae]